MGYKQGDLHMENTIVSKYAQGGKYPDFLNFYLILNCLLFLSLSKIFFFFF